MNEKSYSLADRMVKSATRSRDNSLRNLVIDTFNRPLVIVPMYQVLVPQGLKCKTRGCF
jgi:hypothetical protein